MVSTLCCYFVYYAAQVFVYDVETPYTMCAHSEHTNKLLKQMTSTCEGFYWKKMNQIIIEALCKLFDKDFMELI